MGRTLWRILFVGVILLNSRQGRAQDLSESASRLRDLSGVAMDDRKEAEGRALRALLAGRPYHGALETSSFSRDNSPAYSTGIRVTGNTGEICFIREDQAAYRNGARLGDSVLAINGEPLAAILSRGGLYQNQGGYGLRVRARESVNLVLLSPDSKSPTTLEIEPQPEEEDFAAQPFESVSVERVRYLRAIDLYSSGSGRALAEAISNTTEPLVIDLRRCPLARQAEVTEVASAFAPPETVFATIETAKEARAIVLSNRERSTEGRKVIVLTSRFTCGFGELLIPFLRKHSGAEVIGMRTAGQTRLSTIQRLTSGATITFAGIPIRDCDGLLPTDGYVPDTMINTGLREQYPDVRIERDSQLVTAIERAAGRRSF